MRPNAARPLSFGTALARHRAPRGRLVPDGCSILSPWRFPAKTPGPSRGYAVEAVESPVDKVVQHYKQIFNLPHMSEDGRLHLEKRKDHDEQAIVSGYGYIVDQRSITKNLLFATLLDENPARKIQLISQPRKGYHLAEEQHMLLKSLNRWTPVYYEGLLQRKREPPKKQASGIPADRSLPGLSDAATEGSTAAENQVTSSSFKKQYDSKSRPVQVSESPQGEPADPASSASKDAMGNPEQLPKWLKELAKARAGAWRDVRKSKLHRLDSLEIKLDKLVVLNDYPLDLHFGKDHIVPPHLRHLQIRNDDKLRHALKFRSQVAASFRSILHKEHFQEVETPLLFKSTPEGAREFIVPTRDKGLAYALPQSPQQYKQILMASGIPRYYQFAKCFRDEDLRADRQPEFTQLDIEMAFASGWHVKELVVKLIKHVWSERMGVDYTSTMRPRTLTYGDAMAQYGSDKPDTRLGMELSRIEHMIPVELISKISPLNDPVVEAFRLRLDIEQPQQAQEFIAKFMDSPDAHAFNKNPHGQPGIFVYDTKRPLGGLSPFGFEAAERLEEEMDLDQGDIVIIQARPNKRFTGGSTPVGNLRIALAKAAAAECLLKIPDDWHWLWITDFPMFTESIPDDSSSAIEHLAFTPTHHPFTAPATEQDIDLLLTDPLSAKADHYDLVLNGVEIGGGSRRIHSAEFQTFILRDILKLSGAQMKNFDHLIGVLRAGCPPHAGFAIGFDRLIKEMLRLDSIRDVIAFPKSGSGEDMLVKSPSALTQQQLDTYHLKLRE